MNILEIILLGLACFRLSSLFVNEDGPFKMFRKLREKFGITHYENGIICEIPDKFLCNLFSCVWCLSVWISGALVVGYIFLPTPTIYFSLWLSLSTIAMVIQWLVAHS